MEKKFIIILLTLLYMHDFIILANLIVVSLLISYLLEKRF